MEIAVVILNWNGRAHLETYLPSVVEHSSHARIILADNASSDDSIAFVRKTYPSIEIITNKTNGGFARGYNDALSQIDSDWYVLLNSDVEVTAGWIDIMTSFLLSNPNIGAAQPKIKAYKNKSYFEHAGACGGFIDKNGYPFCRGRIFNQIEEDKGQYDNPMQIFWATGACMFIKAEAYHKAGGLDNDFFAHMEEIDLCWRLQSMGYEIWTNPEAHVYHLGGGTLNYMSPQKTYLNFRNNLFMLHKNYNGFLLGKILWRLTLDGLAGMKFLFGGQFSHFGAILKGHFHYYLTLGALNKKRRAVKKMRQSEVTTIFNGNIVFRFYIGKRKHFSELNQ